jgi:hypothetical protein
MENSRFQFMDRSRAGRAIHGHQPCLLSLYERSPLHAAPELLLDVDSNTAVCFERYFGNESKLDPLEWKFSVSSTFKNRCVSCRVPLHATPGLVYAADTSQEMRNRNFICLALRPTRSALSAWSAELGGANGQSVSGAFPTMVKE